MSTVIILVFVVGYLAIALEHPIKINKTASALLTGVLCWTLFVLSSPIDNVLQSKEFGTFIESAKLEMGLDKFATLSIVDQYHEFVGAALAHHLANISSILFFLLGAMTIVELVDAYQGFRLITDRIATKNPVKLLWLVCWVTFFLSSILDNLTTSIVMVSLIRKLIPEKEMRMFFAGMIIIAANAGGAWTPIGDVTTTMLWIGGQISTVNIMEVLFIPSIFCMLVPLLYLTFTLKGTLGETPNPSHENVGYGHEVMKGSSIMLFLGIGALIFVPVFKTVTHLPPYVGMLLGLGVLWVVSEIINPHADEALRKPYTAAGALQRIDTSSILFFLGILLAVAALESMTTLHHFAEWLDRSVGSQSVIVTLIGLM